jgi:two-component system phosphate regulon sensor histidine kinase PhoR
LSGLFLALFLFSFFLMVIFMGIAVREKRKREELLFRVREEKKKEKKAQYIDRSKLLGRALSLIKEGIVIMDPYGRIVFTNRFARELLGIDENDTGKFFYQAIKNFDVVSLINEAFDESYRVWNDKKINDRYVQVIFGSDLDEKVLLLIDQTPMRKYENLKKDFIANASHELKTPLAALKISLETLEDVCRKNERAIKYIRKAQERIEYMEQLIEDLITLSLLESTNLTLNPKKLKLLPIINSITSHLTEIAEKRGITFSVNVDENTEVCADRKILHAALKNLIDNAVKYNRDGGRVEITYIKHQNEDEVRVCDTGVGIPKSHIPFIFERFYRVEKSRSRKMGGTGLGLSIVKLAVEKLGGKVRVESEEGKGSCFSIILPRRCGIISTDD